MQITIHFPNGSVLMNTTPEYAASAGIDQSLIDAAIAEAEGLGVRDQVRGDIRRNAGDTLTMLGTTADAAALSTLGIAALTVAVAGAGNYSDFKAAFLNALGKLAGDQDMVTISAEFLGKIEAGEVLIPAMAKGMGEVIADIESRSTAVSEALIAARAE